MTSQAIGHQQTVFIADFSYRPKDVSNREEDDFSLKTIISEAALYQLHGHVN